MGLSLFVFTATKVKLKWRWWNSDGIGEIEDDFKEKNK